MHRLAPEAREHWLGHWQGRAAHEMGRELPDWREVTEGRRVVGRQLGVGKGVGRGKEGKIGRRMAVGETATHLPLRRCRGCWTQPHSIRP